MSIKARPKTVVELFSTPGTWTQGTYARNKHDVQVDAFDSDACKFCLFGALRHVYMQGSGPPPPQYHAAVERLKRVTKTDPNKLVLFNDAPGRTQEEILEICKKAGV